MVDWNESLWVGRGLNSDDSRISADDSVRYSVTLGHWTKKVTGCSNPIYPGSCTYSGTIILWRNSYE